MPTVASQILKLAQRVDPRTQRGQVFQSLSEAVTITGAANNGSGLIRITAANHSFITDNQVYIIGVTGTTEANNTSSNPSWLVTRITANTFDLQGSAFASAYVSGGTAIGALIGSVDGQIFTRQRLLDIYNEARMTLCGFIAQEYNSGVAEKAIDGNVVSAAALTFASGVATKPTGFIKEIELRDPSGNAVTVIDAISVPSVRGYEHSTRKFVYRSGTQFIATDSTIVANSSSYSLTYVGITDFTLAQVLAGTTVETFNEEWCPRVLELACAIAVEQGKVSPLALAEKLFRGK